MSDSKLVGRPGRKGGRRSRWMFAIALSAATFPFLIAQQGTKSGDAAKISAASSDTVTASKNWDYKPNFQLTEPAEHEIRGSIAREVPILHRRAETLKYSPRAEQASTKQFARAYLTALKTRASETGTPITPEVVRAYSFNKFLQSSGYWLSSPTGEIDVTSKWSGSTIDIDKERQKDTTDANFIASVSEHEVVITPPEPNAPCNEKVKVRENETIKVTCPKT